jgi:hypothetical protein
MPTDDIVHNKLSTNRIVPSTGGHCSTYFYSGANKQAFRSAATARLRHSPAVSVSYYEETQEAYVDSLTNTIPEQTFTQGEVRFGPTFSYDHKADNGMTNRPRFGVIGVWNFAVDNRASSTGTALGSGDAGARLDGGFTAINTNLWFYDLSGYYDGISIDNCHAHGGKARIVVPFR